MPRSARHEDPDRRFGRAMAWAMAVSILMHVGAFLFFGGHPLPRSPFAAAGERRGDTRAARGGGMEAVELRPPAAPTPPATREVEPVEEKPEAEVPEPEPEPETIPEEVPAIALAEGPLGSGVPGPLPGLGLSNGEGQGDGGTEAEGRFRVVPPRPRWTIMPLTDRPDEMRGKSVNVWVFVGADGHVVSDSTRLDPPTGNRKFDRYLREEAAGWIFEAARRNGQAVAEWFRYTVIM